MVTYKVAPDKYIFKKKKLLCLKGFFQEGIKSSRSLPSCSVKPCSNVTPFVTFPLISQAELMGLSSQPSGHSLRAVELFILLSGESWQFQHLAQGSGSFSFWGLKDANVKSILVIELADVGNT